MRPRYRCGTLVLLTAVVLSMPIAGASSMSSSQAAGSASGPQHLGSLQSTSRWRASGQPTIAVSDQGADPADFVALVLAEPLPPADSTESLPQIVAAPIVLLGLIIGWALLCTGEGET